MSPKHDFLRVQFVKNKSSLRKVKSFASYSSRSTECQKSHFQDIKNTLNAYHLILSQILGGLKLSGTISYLYFWFMLHLQILICKKKKICTFVTMCELFRFMVENIVFFIILYSVIKRYMIHIYISNLHYLESL